MPVSHEEKSTSSLKKEILRHVVKNISVVNFSAKAGSTVSLRHKVYTFPMLI
jgi:hypothetical protein